MSEWEQHMKNCFDQAKKIAGEMGVTEVRTNMGASDWHFYSHWYKDGCRYLLFQSQGECVLYKETK